MAESEAYRGELREAVLSFACGQAPGSGPVPVGAALPGHINIYVFGPQGSGKTSFIRTCFRALYGAGHLEKHLKDVSTSLHRSDDGTSLYSVFALTERICMHDTRGQREYTPEEMQQLKLVLEGRARPNTLITQRRRYWLLMREFWRTDEQMRRTFSRTVMLPKATLDTEPHFAFMVLDPNQQELLLEDEDFRQCYGGLLGDFTDRTVPHALLCTHGDTLTQATRASLLRLPEQLGCRAPPQLTGPRLQGPGGVLRPSPPGAAPGQAPSFHPSSNFTAEDHGAGANGPAVAGQPQRMPDIIRIVTNYVEEGETVPRGAAPQASVERDAEGNDLQQDIHTLLVLLDALRQADSQITQRITGRRPAPMPPEAEAGCPLL